MATKLTSLTAKGTIYPPTNLNPNATGLGRSIGLSSSGSRLTIACGLMSNTASYQGSCFTYDFASGSWGQVTALDLKNTNTGGTVIANYLTVGLSPSGKCLITFDQFTSATAGAVSRRYTTDTAAWTGKVSLQGSSYNSPNYDEQYGFHFDGLNLCVGRPGLHTGVGAGAVYFWTNTTWETTATPTAISLRRTGDTSYLAPLKPPSNNHGDFGWDVHYNALYNLLFVGCPNRVSDVDSVTSYGSVLVYKVTKNTATQWEFSLLQEIFSHTSTSNERFGEAVTVSPDGTLLFVGCRNADNGGSITKGSVQTFRCNIDPTTTAFTTSTPWNYVSTIIDSGLDANANARFGTALRLVDNTMAIGVDLATNGSSQTSGKVLTYTPLLEPFGTVTTRQYTLPVSLKTYNLRQFTLPVSLATKAMRQFTLPVSLVTRHAMTITLPVQLATRHVVQFTLPVYLTTQAGGVATVRQFTLPVSLTTYNIRQFTLPVSLTTYNIRQFTLPVSLTTYNIRQFTLPVSLRTAHSIVITLPVSINTLHKEYVFTLAVKLRTFTRRQFTLPVYLTTTKRSYVFTLPVKLKTIKALTFTLPVKLTTQALPFSASTVHTVTDPNTKVSRQWTATVTIKDTNMSKRVTGQIKIDIRPNAARIAVITLKPEPGVVNTTFFIAASVSIDYYQTFKHTGAIEAYRLFAGVVDTPTYDVNTGIITLTCTDNIARKVTEMTEQQVKDLMPLSYWSELLYPRFNGRWEFILQHLESFNYIVYLDTEGVLTARENTTGTVKYLFSEGNVIHDSLQVTLATTRGLVNYYDISFQVRKKEFRETRRMFQFDAKYVEAGMVVANACGVQQFFDAVSESGAVIHEPPEVQTLGASRYVTNPVGGTAAIINSGKELLLQSVRGSASKRYTQDVVNDFKVIVKGGVSQGEVGILPAQESVSIQVDYVEGIDALFMAQKPQTRKYYTAGNDGKGLLVEEVPEGQGVAPPQDVTKPILGNRPTFYGYLPATFTTWESNTINPKLPLLEVDKWFSGDVAALQNSEHTSTEQANANNYGYTLDGHIDPLFPVRTSGAVREAGEHLFDLDAFVTKGSTQQLEVAFQSVVRKAITKLQQAHRANFVQFDSPIAPTVALGETGRVKTRKVWATGVVSSITHTLNMESGSAISSIELACSTTEPFPEAPPPVTGVQFTLPVTIYTQNKDDQSTWYVPPKPVPVAPLVNYYAEGSTTPVMNTQVITGNPANRLIPMNRQLGDNPLSTTPSGILGSHFYLKETDIDPNWDGHIAPLLPNSGNNTFKFVFGEIPQSHTDGFTGAVSKGTMEIIIPNDEFILRGI